MSESAKRTFVKAEDVETQVFDWGRLSWLSEPNVTAAERFSAGVVKLESGKGHERHNHPYSEEILYVVSGTGLQMVDLPEGKVEREIGPGTLVHIPTAVYHSTVISPLPVPRRTKSILTVPCCSKHKFSTMPKAITGADGAVTVQWCFR